METNLNLKKIKYNFDNNGFIVLRNFFGKKKTLSMKKNLFSFLNQKKSRLKKREMHFAKNSKLINSIHHLKWPYIKKMKKNKKILKIVKTLLNDNIKSFGAEVFAKPPRVGMAVPIHQDNYFWNLNNSKGLTVWIALDKCTKKNGALFYFTKSQLKGLLSHKPSFVPGTSQVLKNMKILRRYKKITPQLNIGDLLIHHCLIVHGSNKNTSTKSRVGLTMRFIGQSSKINKSAMKKYEKKLKKQLNSN